jgi:catechol 2,3-dioxygenase-like lactoylglutathione lyase family enzyme
MAIGVMYSNINGIQHLGVGVQDLDSSWKWYRKFFGVDIPFFNAEAAAPLMDVYTNNETIVKRAAMVLNLKGGCAMEVVQPTSFVPQPAAFEVLQGDLGISIGMVKTPDLKKSRAFFLSEGAVVLSEIVKRPDGVETFFVKDPNGLQFQVFQSDQFFCNYDHVNGGVVGCSIGVSDVEKARVLYSELLGYTEVVYDETGTFEDWANLPGGKGKFRRVLLGQKAPVLGNFAAITGTTYIELVQVLDRTPQKIYKDRIWGDVGFVHLGFDVKGMVELGKKLDEKGYGFTCDTNDALTMGENTRVHCTYIEDDDGTLIEMIEVFKIPLIEKWGFFLNVEKRHPSKTLPKMMLKAMRFSRVKD